MEVDYALHVPLHDTAVTTACVKCLDVCHVLGYDAWVSTHRYKVGIDIVIVFIIELNTSVINWRERERERKREREKVRAEDGRSMNKYLHIILIVTDVHCTYTHTHRTSEQIAKSTKYRQKITLPRINSNGQNHRPELSYWEVVCSRKE